MYLLKLILGCLALCLLTFALLFVVFTAPAVTGSKYVCTHPSDPEGYECTAIDKNLIEEIAKRRAAYNEVKKLQEKYNEAG